RTASLPGWGYPNWRRDLNLTNRPVRTRMPGGVGGVGGADAPPPLSRFWANALDPGEAAAEGRWDAILCRNLLIYFSDETTRKLVATLHRALRPGGVLLLGLTESLLRFDTPFRVEEVGGWFFYVRDG
ncbi:CheR family methyltransferase, partial [Deferrisoma sp.]